MVRIERSDSITIYSTSLLMLYTPAFKSLHMLAIPNVGVLLHTDASLDITGISRNQTQLTCKRLHCIIHNHSIYLQYFINYLTKSSNYNSVSLYLQNAQCTLFQQSLLVCQFSLTARM